MDNTLQQQCSICWEAICSGEGANNTVLLACNHQYHTACIMRHMYRKQLSGIDAVCPLCRHPVNRRIITAAGSVRMGDNEWPEMWRRIAAVGHKHIAVTKK